MRAYPQGLVRLKIKTLQERGAGWCNTFLLLAAVADLTQSAVMLELANLEQNRARRREGERATT